MTPNEIEELQTQKKIKEHVDTFSSFRFNAGAGAGKTYALIETLKYVATNKIKTTNSPQKVVLDFPQSSGHASITPQEEQYDAGDDHGEENPAVQH